MAKPNIDDITKKKFDDLKKEVMDAIQSDDKKALTNAVSKYMAEVKSIKKYGYAIYSTYLVGLLLLLASAPMSASNVGIGLCIASIIAFWSTCALATFGDAKVDKLANKEDISALNSDVAKLKKIIDNSSLKNTHKKEYVKLLKLYRDLKNLSISAKKVFVNKQYQSDIANAKLEKDKTKLKEIKLRGKYGVYGDDAMKNLNETIENIMSMTSILLEAAEATEDLEKAQEFIDKAQELQDKAADIIGDVSDCIEEGKCDDKDVKKDADKKEEKEELKEALTESVNAWYDKAMLCESAEEMEACFKKAEVIQKAIDEIPEEKAESSEYESNVKTDDPEMAEMLELLDGDEEALAILTKNDNSAKIDA